MLLKIGTKILYFFFVFQPTPLPYPYQEVNPLNASQQSKSGIQTAVSLGQVVPNVETEAVVESPLSVLGSLVLVCIYLNIYIITTMLF